jgi:DNA polymerase III subunit beta
MQVTLPRKAFAEALTRVERATDARSTTPILAHAMMVVTPDDVTLVGTNNVMVVQSALSGVHTVTPGVAVFPAQAIREAVAQWTGDAVVATLEENGRLVLTCGRSRIGVTCLLSDDYPSIPSLTLPAVYSITVGAEHLKQLVRHTAFAVCDAKQGKPIYEGVCFRWDGQYLHAMASDTHCLAWDHVDAVGPSVPADAPVSFVVHPTALNDIVKIAAESYVLDVCEATLRVTSGQTTVVCRMVYGQYPDVRRAASTEMDVRFVASCKDMKAALKFVSTVARTETNRVILTCNPDTVTIEAQSDALGEARDDIEADVPTAAIGFRMAFNAEYLSGALGVIDADRLEFRAADPVHPSAWLFHECASFVYMAAPMGL